MHIYEIIYYYTDNTSQTVVVTDRGESLSEMADVIVRCPFNTHIDSGRLRIVNLRNVKSIEIKEVTE